MGYKQMLTPDQAFLLFVYADWVMLLVLVAMLAASVGWGVWALLSRSKGRRRRVFLRALVCLLMFALLWATQSSVMIPFFNEQWNPLLVVLFAAPVIIMLCGVIGSVAYGVAGVLRNGAAWRNAVLKSLLGVAFFGVGIAPHTLAMLMPIISYKDYANYPGTLAHIGDLAPTFQLTDINGTPFQTSELPGKVMVLNFFATWCAACQDELPHLQSIWEEFGSDNRFRMLVVGRDESDKDVKAFQQKNGFTFPMAADPNNSVYSKFATQHIPRTYLISSGRTIVFETTGFYEPELAKLKKLITKELAKKK